MLDSCFELKSWTVLKNTQTSDGSGYPQDTLATDTTVGDSGVVQAYFRNLRIDGFKKFGKHEVEVDGRLYIETSGITEKHFVKNDSGQTFNVVAVDNLHDVGELYQIDLHRSDYERSED